MLTRVEYENNPQQREFAETLDRKLEEYRRPQVDVEATKTTKWGNTFTVMARETAEQVKKFFWCPVRRLL